jgi:hypothetical protein
MTGLTYDSGALIAAERDDRRMWLIHRRALERGEEPTVPVGVLGQVWRGGPQPVLSRLLAACSYEVLSADRAIRAGALLGRAQRSDLIDASVVVGALERGDTVVTSDRDDLGALALAAGGRLSVIDI